MLTKMESETEIPLFCPGGEEVIPDGANFVGEVPVQFRLLIYEATMLKSASSNLQLSPGTVSFDAVIESLESGVEPPVIDELPRISDLLAEEADLLIRIFWFEMKRLFIAGMPSGKLVLTKDWQIYAVLAV
jgi:hypothetical protein